MKEKETLQKFFEEKEVPYQMYSIEHKGFVHQIDTETVIRIILDKTGIEEKSHILDQIVKIDFVNGDINHFLKFLATAYIENNY